MREKVTEILLNSIRFLRDWDSRADDSMPHSHVDTDLLLKRVAAGDQDAVNQLLLRHRSRLRRMVRVRLHPRLAARVDPSDVVQEALLEAHRRLAKFARERPLPFYPWLRQIAWERLVQLQQKHRFARKRSVYREEPFDPLVSDESLAKLARRLFVSDTGPARQVIKSEMRARVREALSQLSEVDRELLTLRYREQLPIEEIAAIMKLGESAVKMRHLRALQKLRSLLGNLDRD